MKHLRLANLGVPVVVSMLLGCSSDPPASSSSSSSSSSSGSGTSSSSSSSSSGGGGIGDCGDKFVDRSAATADRNILWDTSVGSRENRCMQIAVGQKVKLVLPPDGKTVADFTEHPPTANGGDTPNPFATPNATTGEFTFAKAGTFGYKCDVHSLMVGAIKVK